MQRFTTLASVLFALLSAAGQLRAVCAPGQLSGFETACPDLSNWVRSPAAPALASVAAQSGVTPLQDLRFLVLPFDGTGPNIPNITLPSAGFESTGGSGNINSAGRDLLTFAVSARDPEFNGASVKVTVSAGATAFVLHSDAIQWISGTAGTASDWTTFSISLGYLSNLGLDTTAVTSISLGLDDSWTGGCCTASHDLFFDALAVNLPLYNSAGPASPLPPAASASAPSLTNNCGYFSMAISIGSAGNTGVISGYHVYRAVSGVAAGAYASYAYLTSATSTTFIDMAVTAGSTYYYKALPYTLSVNKGGTNSNRLLRVVNAGVDSASTVLGSGFTGPYEDFLGSAQYLSTTIQAAQAVPQVTGLTVTAACTLQISLDWDPMSIPAGGCNSIISYDIYRSASNFGGFATSPVPGGAVKVGSTIVGVDAFTDTTVASGFGYYYAVYANDSISQKSAQFSNSVFASAVGAACSPPSPTPTLTITQTSTPTVVPTSTPVPGLVQIYPNPFRPDKGECFKVGNVANGSKLTIYDMNGDLVYSTTIPISGAQNCASGWDAFNNNGQKVVTGIYYVVVADTVTGTSIHRVAVIRD